MALGLEQLFDARKLNQILNTEHSERLCLAQGERGAFKKERMLASEVCLASVRI